ncbi:Alpha/Beta hydrolase protein [Xylogone sp. PMI_703]|nr:Alpha/Beta hydrolase protein [Xylogone sp. PMI_703]
MTMDTSSSRPPSIAVSDTEDVKPYKIRVSSKYLDLTKKKLEIARLPHEKQLQTEPDWEPGNPKSEIEPLVDFWLEKYSWRSRESYLNTHVPQFRTNIIPPFSSTPLRIHFIHIYSMHTHAVPLLLIPTFPLTNLSLLSLCEMLSDPNASQPFHLVVPSIPGLGFSDAFTSADAALLCSTASVFNTLMLRLGYDRYIVSGSGSGRDSPAEIDYHLPRLVSELFPENCVAVHLINPPLGAPTLVEHPWKWTKFVIASVLRTNIFGYVKEDFEALKATSTGLKESVSTLVMDQLSKTLSPTKKTHSSTVGSVNLRKSNTLAYALCDSPVGLLSFVCGNLRMANPKHELSTTDILDIAHLAWLPGPEASLRFAAEAADEVENLMEKKRSHLKRRSKTIVGLTVFHDDENELKECEEEFGFRYVCPAWAPEEHEVVYAQRLAGHAGLLALEKPEIIAEGIRGLAAKLGNLDDRQAHNVYAFDGFDDTFIDEGADDLTGLGTVIIKRQEEKASDNGMALHTMTSDTVVASADLEWEKIERSDDLQESKNGHLFDSRWLLCLVIFSIWKPSKLKW